MQKLYTEFGEALEKSAKKSWSKIFLEDFLTPTEKVMFAKRFAVICLLDRGVPVSYIWTALSMSPATVQRMSHKYESGKYNSLRKTIKREDGAVWNILEKILRAGLPPIAGRGRWKFLYEK